MLQKRGNTPESAYGNITLSDSLEKLRYLRIYIETYGCRYNFGDTVKLIEVLKYLGSTLVSSAEEADAVIINTCTVVGPTERKMLRRLSRFRNYNLFVMGCMPAVQMDAIFAVCNPVLISSAAIHEAYQNIRTVPEGGVAVVQVAQGCAGRCSYCLARVARGPLKSFAEEEILAEIAAYIQDGTPEIQITAQDVCSWGLDVGTSLTALLYAIDHLSGRFMIRVGMMNPATVLGILDDLIDAFKCGHIFKFIHLPVQSGSDHILDQMGRAYTVADFEEIVLAFKNRFPEITLATDMIVGFPGETEEDFSESLELIERVRPNKVNITRYSQRPFTPCSSEKDFPDWIKKDRSRRMNTLSEKIYTSVNKKYLEKLLPFVVTETIKKGSVMARSPNYLGIVINEDLPIGYDGQVRLKKDRKYYFLGQMVV
ncbi:MAG: tRNA (N(6)-L-threonylcarbamoyladenosine(37)-C(2))-methylthiotransferase [Methanoregula sp.]